MYCCLARTTTDKRSVRVTEHQKRCHIQSTLLHLLLRMCCCLKPRCDLHGLNTTATHNLRVLKSRNR